MERALHKRIKIFSVIAMVIFTIATIAGILLKRSGRFELDFSIMEIEIVWVVFMVFPLISIITSYSIIHTEKSWIRKAWRYALVVYPVIILATIFFTEYISNNTLVFIIVATLLVSLTILVLLRIFVFASATSLTSTIIFLSLIIVSIVFRRFHLPLAGGLLSLSLLLFSLGCYLYGIRCLYLAEKNKFLKYVAFLGCCIVTISLMGLLFKMQRWPANPQMVTTGRVSLVVGTIIVLLSLPSSGFIEWQPLHKKILRRLVFPWVLLFLLFIIKFLLPEVDAILWAPKSKDIKTGFDMRDYTIEIKNNLKPE